jgi:regulator of protease activity HflC (stomatin/prohibitin superfamily)
MAEHHHHHHPPQDDGSYEDHVSDPASRSLSEALRLSFRVLTVVMVLVVGAFLATGLENIEDNQVGLIKVFGRIVGQAEPGLAFGWPFPIGEIEVVSTAKRTLEVDEFWFHLTARQRAQELDEIQTDRQGLDPVRDGALLTGDRSLYHIRMTVTWEVTEPIAFRQNLADPEKILNDAVIAATIRVAAGRTAESIHREGAGTQRMAAAFAPFAPRVRQLAQDDLNAVDAGVQITNIAIDERTWPLVARKAYNDAQRASDEMELKVNQARREAIETLRDAAGTVYARLVGEPGQPTPPADWAANLPYDLIGQYNLLQESPASRPDRDDQNQQDDEDKQDPEAVLLARIDSVLTSRDLGGQAQSIISQAQAYRSSIEQIVRQRANRFDRLLGQYNDPKTRELLLADLWAGTLERVFNLPLLEPFYVPETTQSVVLIVPPSEQATQEISAEQTRARREERNSD